MDSIQNASKQNLINKLISMAEARDLVVSQETANMEIDNALLEYYNDRHYTPTETQLYELIYEGLIVQLALSAILKMGAEGENYHSEGGVIRTYDSGDFYPVALTNKIIPLAKGVG